jgi:formylglycine-generating enzyme required for sulfatase activity
VHREMVARSESAIAASAAQQKKKSLAFPTPNDIVKIPDAVVSQSVGSQTLVTNIGTAMCYGLNGTGGRIWELIAQGHGIRSISDTIAREYNALRPDVERDVMALAYQLAQRDLVRVVHRATTDAPAR